MNGTWKRASAVAALTAATAMLFPACAENESSLFIRGCLIPSDDTCVVDPSGDATLLLGGFLDATVGSGSYSCPLLIGNQLVPVGDDITLRTETSRIFVYAFDVTISDATTGQQLTAFSTPASGVVDPAQGSPPGYGAVNALLVDVETAQTAAKTGAELVVSVIARGRTLGGTELESGAWQYQIGVCSGCTCKGTSTKCSMPTDDLKADCRQGLDQRCRFVDTDCP